VQQRELRVLREQSTLISLSSSPLSSYSAENNPLYPQLPQKNTATMVKESINLQNRQVCAKPSAR